MTATLIQEPELMQWCGYQRRNDLVNWLQKQHIPYLLGRDGRVCCTTAAVNLPLLKIQAHNAYGSGDIEF